MPNNSYRLGIDLGGTKIETTLLDPQGNSLLRERMATPRDPDGPTEYTKKPDRVTEASDFYKLDM